MDMYYSHSPTIDRILPQPLPLPPSWPVSRVRPAVPGPQRMIKTSSDSRGSLIAAFNPPRVPGPPLSRLRSACPALALAGYLCCLCHQELTVDPPTLHPLHSPSCCRLKASVGGVIYCCVVVVVGRTFSNLSPHRLFTATEFSIWGYLCCTF